MKEYLVLKVPHGIAEETILGEYEDYQEAMNAMTQAFAEERRFVESLDRVRELFRIWVNSNMTRKNLLSKLIAIQRFTAMDTTLYHDYSQDLKKLDLELSDCWYDLYLMNAPILGYQVYEKGSRESIGGHQEHSFYVESSAKYGQKKQNSSFGLDFVIK